MLRVGVLMSSGGVNPRAVLDAEKSGMIRHVRVVYVLLNNAAAYALQRTVTAGITNECTSPAGFPGREAFHRALLEAVEREKLDLIVLTGYFVKIPNEMIHRYRSRILNIHPSLIPGFCDKGVYGLKVREQALRRDARVTGAAAYLMDERLDEGPILLQKAVEVKPGDMPETL